MLLLISNDDGVEAPGLRALVEALSGFSLTTGGAPAELVVVAPREEQSAKSHALTMHEPLRVEPWATPDSTPGARWFAVRGTPADCVYIGVHHLAGRRPAAVISGVNRGTNLGDDIHYSGTVAAAMEGALMGIPALAVSLGVGERDRGGPFYATAGRIAAEVLRQLLRHPLPRHGLLNLNVPGAPYDQVRGLKAVPMGKRYYHPMVQINQDPRGRAYYWIGGDHDRFEGWDGRAQETAPGPVETAGEDGPEFHDGWWFERGYATLTPLHPDLTDHESLRRLADWTGPGAPTGS